MSRLFRAAVLAPVLSAALVLSAVSPAGAAVPLSGVVSPAAVSWTPNVFAGTNVTSVCDQWFGSGGCGNATVYSTAIVNGEVVVAGAFTQVCQPGPASSGHCKAGTLVTRDDIFAYQLGTGIIDPNFVPQFDQGPAYSVAAGPNNTVYVGGAFTTVNGGTNNRGVVQLNVTPGNAATDGQVVSAFGGRVDNTVYSLAVSGSALYIGGQFSLVDGSTKEAGIARLDATTGAADSTFAMSVSTPAVSGLALKVAAMSVSADGSTLAIAGTFLDVNGQSRPRVALISTGGGLGFVASLENWAAPILANNCSAEHDYVRGIDISPDGSFLVIADTGYRSSPLTAPSVCDAAARFPTAPTGTNIAPTWVNYSGGDSQYSVQITGGVVYTGGHHRWLNDECGNNRFCEANTVLVMGFSAIDANTGLAIAWFHPMTLRGNGVVSLTSFPAGLFSGSSGGVLLGDNVTVNGQGAYHSFEALFPLTSPQSTPPTFGSVPSGMFAQGRLGGSDESTAGIAAMCVDDTGNSSTPGTKVEFSTCTDGAEQNWTVQANGNLTINGLCLDTVGQATAPGTAVDVNTCGSSTTQVWTQGAGNTLVNQAANLCLDDPGSSTKNGTVLDTASCTGGTNQVWPLPAAPVPSSLIPAGVISAQVPSGKAQPACITDTNNSKTSGTAAEMSTCLDSQAQNASIESNGTIGIQGLCLDTAGQSTASGSQVVLNTCNSSTTQVWAPSTGHTLVNQASGLCLNAAAQSNGATLTIAACSSTNVNQQWWLPAV
jgi:hypothetical protein